MGECGNGTKIELWFLSFLIVLSFYFQNGLIKLNYLILYWKRNFIITISRLVSWSRWSVCHNIRKLTLPFFYQRTCYLHRFYIKNKNRNSTAPTAAAAVSSSSSCSNGDVLLRGAQLFPAVSAAYILDKQSLSSPYRHTQGHTKHFFFRAR